MSKKPAIAISTVVKIEIDDEAMALAASEMDLPPSAEMDGIGNVTVRLRRPVTMRQGGAEETVTEVMLRRMKGPDMRLVLNAKDGTKAMLARAADMSPAKMALLYGKMDAADVSAITQSVAEMIQFGEGLPDRATERDDGTIELTLRFPTWNEAAGDHKSLVFHPLTGADLDAMKRTVGVQTLLLLLARSVKKTPKDMGELFDEMDAADIVAAQRVVGFLSGAGQKTGR